MLLRAHVPTFPHPPPTLLFPHPPPYTPREYTAVCLQQRYRTMAPSNVALLLCCVLSLASIGLGCVRACLCLIARRTSRLFIVTSCWVACVRTIARIVYLADWAIKLARCCAHTSDPDACACTSLSASCCPTSVRWRHLRLLPQCVVCAICAFIPSY